MGVLGAFAKSIADYLEVFVCPKQDMDQLDDILRKDIAVLRGETAQDVELTYERQDVLAARAASILLLFAALCSFLPTPLTLLARRMCEEWSPVVVVASLAPACGALSFVLLSVWRWAPVITLGAGALILCFQMSVFSVHPLSGLLATAAWSGVFGIWAIVSRPYPSIQFWMIACFLALVIAFFVYWQSNHLSFSLVVTQHIRPRPFAGLCGIIWVFGAIVGALCNRITMAAGPKSGWLPAASGAVLGASIVFSVLTVGLIILLLLLGFARPNKYAAEQEEQKEGRS